MKTSSMCYWYHIFSAEIKEMRELVMDNSALTSQSNEYSRVTSIYTQYSRLNLYFRFIPSTATEKTHIQYLVRKCTIEHYMELELVISRMIIRYSVQTEIYVNANKYNISIAESHPTFFPPLLPDLPSRTDYLQVLSSVLQLLQNLSHEQLQM